MAVSAATAGRGWGSTGKQAEGCALGRGGAAWLLRRVFSPPCSAARALLGLPSREERQCRGGGPSPSAPRSFLGLLHSAVAPSLACTAVPCFVGRQVFGLLARQRAAMPPRLSDPAEHCRHCYCQAPPPPRACAARLLASHTRGYACVGVGPRDTAMCCRSIGCWATTLLCPAAGCCWFCGSDPINQAARLGWHTVLSYPILSFAWTPSFVTQSVIEAAS